MSATCLCTKKFLNYRTDSDIKNDIFLLLLIVKGNKYFFAFIWKIQKRRKISQALIYFQIPPLLSIF